ncbi:Nucleolar protein 10 [Coelomomyces lativittatus]|nr:Nucleolar protein 10 [Coelomomyces lativittatus]KAJ1513396.1 Nucleolar protein 10 [Coelomomyces lativittatus]
MVLSVTNPNNVKVYRVGGESQFKKKITSSVSSINHLNVNFLSKTRSHKKKNATSQSSSGFTDLIQDFSFPEACFRIKLTPDGRHIMATGTYKPHFRVFDLSELSMKFCRHTSSDNVQFRFLTSDWTKSIHLQSDRSIEFHTSMGCHYSLRIPHFGRALDYCESTCEVLVGTSSSFVYRLDLCQGQFKAPLITHSPAIQTVSVNPAHHLWTLGGSDGYLEAWDPRCKTQLHRLQVSPTGLTCLVQRNDGLTLAAGDAEGMIRLYDLRHSKSMMHQSHPYATEIHSIHFHEGSNHVVSSDRHSVRVWERNSGTLLTTLEAQAPINDICVVPDSGMVFLATEAPQLGTYFIPVLGTAPSFCTFLDTLVGEEETVGTNSNAVSHNNSYQEGKFVSQEDIEKLNLTDYIGTPHLKAYMHGYFVPWSMYKRAISMANPFAYEEYQAQLKKSKLEAMTASRILPLIKQKRQQELVEMNAKDTNPSSKKASNVHTDPRFKAIFEDPEFVVDETSVEFKRIYTCGKSFSKQKQEGHGDPHEDLDSDEEALLARGYNLNARNLSATKNSDSENLSASDSETEATETSSKALSYHKKIDTILRPKKPDPSTSLTVSKSSIQAPAWERVKDESTKLKNLPFGYRVKKEGDLSSIKKSMPSSGAMELTFELDDAESPKKSSYKRKRGGRVR